MNYELKFAVIKSGKTQIEIAREAKIQEYKLSKIVNGHIKPTESEIRKIAIVLALPISRISASSKLDV